jgi:hypothetical protein
VPGPQGPQGPTGSTGPAGPAASYQAGSGIAINTGTTPPTISTAAPYLPLAGGALTGNLSTTGDLTASGNVHTSSLYMTNSYVFFAGNTSTTAGPLIYGDSSVQAFRNGSGAGGWAFQNNAGVNQASIGGTGTISTIAGYQARSGTPGPFQSNLHNIGWPGGGAHLWIDNVDQGTINVTCDYRIKENVADLPSTWNKVKTLRPIRYTRKEHEELRHTADAEERWGFIAHELQEALLPTAATGFKDAPNLVQSPDLMAVMASLTRALQEAMTRIETLEAGR